MMESKCERDGPNDTPIVVLQHPGAALLGPFALDRAGGWIPSARLVSDPRKVLYSVLNSKRESHYLEYYRTLTTLVLRPRRVYTSTDLRISYAGINGSVTLRYVSEHDSQAPKGLQYHSDEADPGGRRRRRKDPMATEQETSVTSVVVGVPTTPWEDSCRDLDARCKSIDKQWSLKYPPREPHAF